jgi:hypothetical protein
MRKASGHPIVFLSLLLLIGLTATPARAVIFASDALYFYGGGKRIADNSVLVVRAGPAGERLKVCARGSLWLRQGPTWKSGPHTFIQAAAGRILTLQAWQKTPEGQAIGDRDRGYQDYLRKKSRHPVRRVSIVLPTVAQSPPLDRTPHPPPPRGMTGGKIGHDRFFRVDLDRGTVTQVPREQIPRDEKAVTGNARQPEMQDKPE